MNETMEKEINKETIPNNQILETDFKQEYILSKSDTYMDEIDSNNINENLELNQKKSEEETPSEKIDLEDANTTNCLALTIKKEHKLLAVKNVFVHSLKVTWKVIVSAVTLNILKFFF